MGKININDIKAEIKRSGASKGKLIYFKEGTKVRVRFLTDFEDGISVTFHDSYAKSINQPCQEMFGRECTMCDDDELRTRNKYCWAVYDYEAKEVKLILEAINQCSPVSALASFYETYGTLTDRDYEIKQLGSGSSKTFTIVPLEKRAFRNPKAKPLSEKAMLKIIDKAYPSEDVDEEEMEENPKKGTGKGKADTKAKNQKKNEDEWEDEEEKPDYSKMKPLELYKLCQEHDISCQKKKSQKYYIELLEKYDEEQDGDEWEDEDFMNIPDDMDEELPFN